MSDMRTVIVQLDPMIDTGAVSRELLDRVSAVMAERADGMLKDVLIAGHHEPQETTLVWPPKPERRYAGVLNMIVCA